ncbi:MAG TPA: PAS domain S-box protein [Bryobacteraceae bacterium]|nr:PAS domain S-box protein [Bryobacteraceae bacterium]
MQRPSAVSRSSSRHARPSTDDSFRLLIQNNERYSIFVLDSVGRIKSWNAAALRIYGFSADDIIGRNFRILYPAADIKGGAPEADLKDANVKGSATIERWRLRKDGSRFWASIHLTALFDTNRDLYGYGEITEDCTDSRRKNEMYGTMMNSLRAHIAVVDQQGTILMVNDRWKRFAMENGATSLERIGPGVNYLEVCRRAKGAFSEGAGEALRGLEAVLRRSLDEFTLEYPCPCLKTDRWFLLSAMPWGPNGDGAVISHTDITEHVRAERKLRDSEEHYRALIENEVDVVTILKPDGTICFESPALERILGYAPEELIGKNAFDFVNATDLPEVKKELGFVLTTNEVSKPVEFGFRHKDGSWRILEGVARNLIANPAVQGIIVNSRDITERREAEAELREKEAALQSSHEQLRALAGRLLEAEEGEWRRLSRELHDDLNQKLAMLAVDLGAIARSLRDTTSDEIERELRDVQSRIVKVSDEVRTMAYQLHPSILDHLGLAVALRSYCAEFAKRENLEVKCFHRNIKQSVSPEVASCLYRITQEALRNVAKHANAKRVSVSLVGSKNHVSLTIRDFGVGFRIDASKSRPSLGLISMSERARQIGGEFKIESTPDDGTTLTVQIPWKDVPVS